MSGHSKWSSIKHKRVKRCQKLTIEGDICNKPVGTCIHFYVPTRLGSPK